MALTDVQTERYARHIALPAVGTEGQQMLLRSRVLIVGSGGLGSPAAMYLAAAGVGSLRLADHDRVEASNLQRQILHRTADIGRLKTESAAQTIGSLNPDVSIEAQAMRFSEATAPQLLEAVDFVIDATDTAGSKFAVAAACHHAGIPYCHGGIAEFTGQVLTVRPGITACLRCVFGDDMRTADIDAQQPRGPLGAVPGIIGAMQAAEALKAILHIGTPLENRLLLCDVLKMTFRTLAVKRNPECPVCGRAVCSERPTVPPHKPETAS